jgi:hypothetical protein
MRPEIKHLTPTCGQTVAHHAKCWRWLFSVLLLINALPVTLRADTTQKNETRLASAAQPVQIQCLPDHGGYLRARLSGSISADLDLNDAQLDCTGSIRPNGNGLRLRFSVPGDVGDTKLVLLFGVTGLKEGESGRVLPANLTLIREGKGEFYATQGDGKCTVDEIHQTPLQGWPLKRRSWRVEARGFCTQPARALTGTGSVLVTRFDFAGRAEFSSEDDAPADVVSNLKVSP